MRHLQLRNVIERIFGVIKALYKTLTYPRPFKMKAQVRAVAALCVLHNILNNFDKDKIDTIADALGATPAEEIAKEDGKHVYNISRTEIDASVLRRDEIASAM